MPKARKPKPARGGKTPYKKSAQQQSNPNKQGPKKSQEPTIPFVPEEDRILLIGEGDFSFARSIVEEHGCCDVTATSYDGHDALLDKYRPQIEEHLAYLEEEGQTALHNVDATKLDADKRLRASGLFDRILFNFPHVGGKSTDVNRQVRFNQELLVKFFSTAQTLLAPARGGGEEGSTIVVTLFEGEPYTLWNVRDLARHSGLEVVRSFRFQAEAYPGYSHARTLGNIEGGGGWKGEDREARSYVFKKKTPLPADSSKSPMALAKKAEEKRKRKEEGSDSDD